MPRLVARFLAPQDQPADHPEPALGDASAEPLRPLLMPDDLGTDAHRHGRIVAILTAQSGPAADDVDGGARVELQTMQAHGPERKA